MSRKEKFADWMRSANKCSVLKGLLQSGVYWTKWFRPGFKNTLRENKIGEQKIGAGKMSAK